MLNFDFNLPSNITYEANYNDIIDQQTLQLDVNYNDEVPVTITALSSETLIIDLNINPNSDREYPILEIDTNQIREEMQQHLENEEEDVATDENQDQSSQEQSTKKIFLSNTQRSQICTMLEVKSSNKRLQRGMGITKGIASLFGVHQRTIQRHWVKVRNTPGHMLVDGAHKKPKCGRKRKEVDLNKLFEIPMQQRTTLHSVAAALGIGYSLLWRHLKEGLVRRHSNAIKPHLKEENKISRLKFCLSMLDESNLSEEPKFQGMYNVIHIDEKWFYMTKKSETVYLHPLEQDPYRTVQSKNYITKVMFLAAVARPRYDDQGGILFYGKIGIFPFVKEQEAQRSSRNREAGTMELKAMTSVRRNDVKEFLIEKVIPAIRAKWPQSELGQRIYIQQDNARTHVQPTDSDFQLAASESGFDIRLICQPANSPDMNILDLGFFRSIQSLQQKIRMKSVKELVEAVETSFHNYPETKLNNVFLTLQQCMKETMKIGGSNRYKIPHMKKGQLERHGLLPKQIECEFSLVQHVKDTITGEQGI